MMDNIGSKEDALIAQYIDPNPHGRGPAEARLSQHGTSIWALVAYWRACSGDVQAVAHDYHLPVEAVEAALAYYQRHRDLIDARLLLNTAV
jgi:uncharacterized protein (DUF433 family)